MFKIAQHYLYTKHATKMISEFLGKLKKVKQGVGVGVGNPTHYFTPERKAQME
jgi:hypothetical protein